jgi:hypothetical protein
MLSTNNCPRAIVCLSNPVGLALMFAILGYILNSAAASEFHVTGQSLFNSTGEDHYDLSGFFQAGHIAKYDDTSHVPEYSVHTQGDSLADIGGLHAHSFAQIIKNVTNPDDNSGIGCSSDSLAMATYNDVTIAGPPGTFSTSINMTLGGSMTAGSFAPGTGHNAVNGTATVVFFVNGSNKGGGNLFITSTDGSVPVLQGSGVLTAWGSANPNITSPNFSVPTNTPFTLSVELLTHADAAGAFSDSFILDANTDFSNTLKFISDGPVFNLPAGAGLVVNSADAGIVDNRFVAPEPSAKLLISLAAMGFAWKHGRK